MLAYPALFDPDRESGGFVVTFPDFGWGVTQGEHEQEATEMATDLLGLLIGDRIKRDIDLPKAGRPRSRTYRMISLPVLQDAKAVLHREWRASGIRKAEFARRIGMPRTNLDRLFDLNHHSRLDQLEAAFTALNKKLSIDVRNAAQGRVLENQSPPGEPILRITSRSRR